MPLFKVQLQQYVEKLATAEVEAKTRKEALDKAYEIGATLTWTDGDDSYGVEAYAIMNDKDEIVWER